jgi:hypothetical protein
MGTLLWFMALSKVNIRTEMNSNTQLKDRFIKSGYSRLVTAIQFFVSEYRVVERPIINPRAPFQRKGLGHALNITDAKVRLERDKAMLRKVWAEIDSPDPATAKEWWLMFAKAAGKSYEGEELASVIKIVDRALMLAQSPSVAEPKEIVREYKSNQEILEAKLWDVCYQGILWNPNGANAKGIIFG